MATKGPLDQTDIFSFSKFSDVHFILTSHGFNLTLHTCHFAWNNFFYPYVEK